MSRTLLTPDHVVDGSAATCPPGTAVLLEGARILDVGPSAELRKNADNEQVLTGTLTPGLLDCHTHLCLAATADPATTLRSESRTRTALRGVRHLAQHLRAGVTTIRDLGCGDGLDLDLMRAQAAGAVAGPRVVAAGKLIAMTGGHACYLGVEADGVASVTRAVREQLKAGSQVIKVVATGGIISAGVEPGAPQLSREELTAAVTEAVNAGRRVAAHAQGTVGIHNAVMAGVHSIEHAFWLDDACIQQMKARGTYMVATFAAAHAMTDHLGALPAFIRVKMEGVGDAHAQSFRAALAGGVLQAAGTDAGTPFNPHGSLWRELELLVHHGLSPHAALRAATSAAAGLLGREELGVLRAGAVADLCLWEANPAVDVRATRRPRAVWQAGRPVDLAALDALLTLVSPGEA